MDKNSELALERLTREVGSWKSIELKTNDEFVNSSGSQDPNMFSQAIFREDYIETASGQRFDRVLRVPKDGAEKLNEAYCDGDKCADVSFEAGPGSKQTQIEIKKSFKQEAQFGTNFRPIPLRYLYYIGTSPLPRVLKDAEPLGPAIVLDRPCETFLVRRFQMGSTLCDLVYTLDRETGLPLKLVGYNDETGYAAGRPSWRWEALGVDKVQGHLFPMKSEEVIYFPPPDPKTKGRDRSAEVYVRTTHVVETLRFDGDYPRTTFWPVVAPEATVFDAITRKIAPAKVRPTVVAQVANPPRAEVPRGWSDLLPTFGLGLGVVLLLVGVRLWWKGRAAVS